MQAAKANKKSLNTEFTDMDPQASPNPKQQVVERVRSANNVLVTVSTNPTVDQLAACIGLTLMLNKLEKHATAVFSGQVPSTLEFLKPEETIEQNTDSLRDFIISLDKSKADKLRYKVEDSVVRIFITPYRTSLSQNDLEFTQGDFNVDVVLALGVTQREQLDQAIVQHGRILHDAAVITVTAGPAVSELGTINWQDPAASSLSEMLVSISEAFQGGLLDGQIATAFLTGIVSETARFSNPKTSPKVMTMAAQLMAAGANQQLIATQLSTTFESGSAPAPESPVNVADGADGSLAIHHGEPDQPTEEGQPSGQDQAATQDQPAHDAQPGAGPKLDDIHIDDHGTFVPPEPVGGSRIIQPLGAENQPPKTELSKLLAQEPSMGGTFTANSESEDVTKEPTTDAMSLPPIDQDLLNPDAQSSTPLFTAPDMPPSMPHEPEPQPEQPPSPPEQRQPPQSEPQDDGLVPIPSGVPIPKPLENQEEELMQHANNNGETLLDIEKAVHSTHVEGDQGGDGTIDAARDAVQSAINSLPYDERRPEPVQSLNANPLDTPPSAPPLPDSTADVPLVSIPSGVSNDDGRNDNNQDSSSSHGLLPMSPPPTSEDNQPNVDPLVIPVPGGSDNTSTSAFDPTAPLVPSDSDDNGGGSPPPPVPPPMVNFPMPPSGE